MGDIAEGNYVNPAWQQIARNSRWEHIRRTIPHPQNYPGYWAAKAHLGSEARL
jgi:hypothetical protein